MPQSPCRQYASSGRCSYRIRCKFPHIKSGATVIVAQPRRIRQARKQKNTTAIITSPTALEDFFGQYSGFNYNPSQSASREFYRLCDFNTWEREDAERQVAYDAFKTALVVQFNHVYGTDEHSLSAWRNLCEVIGVVPIPEGLAACRKAVRGSHVNIVDLVDAKGTGNTVTRFLSEEELSEYTQMNSKYFPKGSACAGGLLKYLLRKIITD